MLRDFFDPTPEVQATRRAQEKSQLFWRRVKFVLGIFFVALFFLLCSNASDNPWAGASHRDSQGNPVTEPDWPAALAISVILSGALAAMAL
jgi:hypothetical protein